MEHRGAGWAGVGAVLVGLTCAGPAHGDAPAAQALFEQARKAMQAHKYAEACPKFEDSYRLQEALGTLLNLAACYEAEGRLATAWTTFLEVASKARATGQAARANVARERAAALAPKLSNLIIDVPSEARVSGLEIRRDGDLLGPAEWGTPLPTDPGDHMVRASAPGHTAWEKTISVAGGAASARISVPVLEVVPPAHSSAPVATLPATPPETPAPRIATKDETERPSAGIGRPLGVVLSGVGLAGIAVGGVFGWLAKGPVDRANQECASSRCGPSYAPAVHDHDQAVQYGLISDIGFIAGGTLLVSGAALFFFRADGEALDGSEQRVGRCARGGTDGWRAVLARKLLNMKQALLVLVACLAGLTSACTGVWGLKDIPNQESGEDASVRDGGVADATADSSRPPDAFARGDGGRDATQLEPGDASDGAPNPPLGPGDGGIGVTLADGGAPECAATELLCGGECVPNDVRHCGACTNDCTNLVNVSGATTCSAGQCHFPASSCLAGWADCNGSPQDGCEENITQPAHCGSCTTSCSSDGGAPVCSSSGTSYACASGCPSTAATQCSGSCVDVSSNANHCGACATVCTTNVAHAQASCTAGTCGFTCNSGFSLCSGACVDHQTDANNCGGCGAACGAGQVCSAGKCVCGAGLTSCGGVCVNEQGDNANCGACASPCGAGSTCSAGKCACTTGFASCGGACVSATDVHHCGSCTNDCTSLPNVSGMATCTAAGKCSFPGSACAAGWADCNGNPEDGCETNITQAAHCGGCTVSCGGGTPVCSGSTSAGYSCVSGCPAATPTLCGATCVDTATNANDCGSCTNACTTMVAHAQPTCAGGKCGFACNSTFSSCGGGCVDEQNDANNCGGCGTKCAAGLVCSVGKCVCGAGLTSCNGACVNEQTDNANCGTCGNKCGTGSSCSAGKCVCNAMLTACTAGCVNVQSDNANCGTCGVSCGPGFSCSGGKCVCNTPTTNPCQNATCGSATDACGNKVTCGSNGGGCPSGFACNSATGGPGTCVCAPKTSCSAGANCGSIPDGCGGTVRCGPTCGSGLNCDANNRCNPFTCVGANFSKANCPSDSGGVNSLVCNAGQCQSLFNSSCANGSVPCVGDCVGSLCTGTVKVANEVTCRSNTGYAACPSDPNNGMLGCFVNADGSVGCSNNGSNGTSTGVGLCTFEACDGPNDCDQANGFICCATSIPSGVGCPGGFAGTGCFQLNCPTGNAATFIFQMCDPKGAPCPSGTTCQTSPAVPGFVCM